MKHIIVLALIVAIVAIFASELVRVTRIVVAYFKGDEYTVNRLTHTYEECECIALKKYGCSKELFAQYYKEVREFNPDALPWDALDFCAWDYDVLNNQPYANENK